MVPTSELLLPLIGRRIPSRSYFSTAFPACQGLLSRFAFIARQSGRPGSMTAGATRPADSILTVAGPNCSYGRRPGRANPLATGLAPCPCQEPLPPQIAESPAPSPGWPCSTEATPAEGAGHHRPFPLPYAPQGCRGIPYLGTDDRRGDTQHRPIRFTIASS